MGQAEGLVEAESDIGRLDHLARSPLNGVVNRTAHDEAPYSRIHLGEDGRTIGTNHGLGFWPSVSYMDEGLVIVVGVQPCKRINRRVGQVDGCRTQETADLGHDMGCESDGRLGPFGEFTQDVLNFSGVPMPR